MSEYYQYHLIVHSRWRLISFFTILFCGGVFVMDKLSLDAKMLMTILLMAWLILSFSISYWLSRGKLRLVLSEEGIKCFWERRFFLSFSKGWYAMWKQTKSYFMYGDRGWDCFALNFTNGYCFRFRRINFLRLKDDYEKFESNFGKNANELMKRADENSIGLRRCVDIFECEEYDEKALKRRKTICLITMVLLSLIVLACLIDAIVNSSFDKVLAVIVMAFVLVELFYTYFYALNHHERGKK